MLSVDVVIPVYGQWELTERCLATLAKRDACVRRVIVVDDTSPDETAARLRERRDVVPVLLERNGGFAKACNAGARAGDADAIFFLNNDTLVPHGTIERLAATLDESGAGAVGPKLLNGDGTLQVAGLAMLDRLTHFERLYVYLDATLPQAQIPYAPAALSGAAVLVRRSAFDAVGGFEEAFLNGSEDVDLSLKLWAAGYANRYEPRAVIIHLEGASRGKAIDGAPNDRLLRARWDACAGAIPRYHEPLSPLLDLRWRSANPLEATVRHAFRPLLREHAGARVVVNAPLLARAMVALDRRTRLTIVHGDGGAPDGVAWCAPDTLAGAATLRARNAARYWVPSLQAAELLHEAGVPPDAVSVVRPGFAAAPALAARPLTHAVLVRREHTPPDAVAPFARALAGRAFEELVAERADAAALARVAAAPLVAFADAGDPWGLIGGAALAGGAVVVALAGSPFLEVMPLNASIAMEDTASAAEALRVVCAEPDSFAAYGPRAARESSRVCSDVQAGRRIRELARSLVHGVVDPRSLEMTPAAAAALVMPAQGKVPEPWQTIAEEPRPQPS